MLGFEVSADDVEAVLKAQLGRLINPQGMAPSEMAVMLLPQLDTSRIEKAALKHATDLDEQTVGAHEEVARQLTELGVLRETGADEEADVESGEDGQILVVGLTVRYQRSGVPEGDLCSALERSVETAIGLGLLADDGPATVNQWDLSVKAMSQMAAAVTESGIEDWLRARVLDGNLSVDELIQLAARYAVAERTSLLEELAERMVPQTEEDEVPGPEVGAEVWPDDRAMTVKFNAAAWLSQASCDEVEALAECGWRGDYAADAVAEWEGERNPDVGAVFTHVNALQIARVEHAGFECAVDGPAAMAWLKEHRKGVWAVVRCAQESVRLMEAQEPEIRGRWDWMDERGNGCDASLETKAEAAINAVETLGLEGLTS